MVLDKILPAIPAALTETTWDVGDAEASRKLSQMIEYAKNHKNALSTFRHDQGFFDTVGFWEAEVQALNNWSQTDGR